MTRARRKHRTRAIQAKFAARCDGDVAASPLAATNAVAPEMLAARFDERDACSIGRMPAPYPAAPQQAPQPQAPQPKKGFPVWAMVLLGCLGAFLLLGGVLAVLGVYGMRKYIANAKTAEAMNSLGQIAKDELAAYESEAIDPHGSAAHRLCPSASRSVPPSISAVRGTKYQSSPGEWTVDAPSHAGFACLKFSLDAPQYYLYSYEATPSSFDATAQGDLNGDGVTSKFVVRGKVSAGALQIEPNLQKTNPEE